MTKLPHKIIIIMRCLYGKVCLMIANVAMTFGCGNRTVAGQELPE